MVLVSSIRPKLSLWQEITEAAMRGELDFFGSLKSRVALLKGALPGDGDDFPVTSSYYRSSRTF